MCELHLATDGHQATGDVVIVLPQQVNGEHHVVDVVKHECMLIRVLLLLGQECNWMIAPMSKGI